MEIVTQRALTTLLERYPLLYEMKTYKGKWTYDYGVVLKGMADAWKWTGDARYLTYVKNNLDHFVQENGEISKYKFDSFNIDNINTGKLFFLLYEETGEEKYRIATSLLFQQLLEQPRTSEGAFWHKKIYPYQIWLDGLYMGSPFYAEYLVRFKGGDGLEDVIKQFSVSFEHLFHEDTGLLHHAWDEKRVQPWADPETGLSENYWARSIGWYVMALVDVIDIIGVDHEYTSILKDMFNKIMRGVLNVRDPKSKMWYQVIDKGDRHGNYLEASASSMFFRTLVKADLLGILDLGKPWGNVSLIEETYEALLAEFVFYTKENWVNLIRNVEVGGLGGEDNRDGTFEYYISEPIITNDMKGYGSFLQGLVDYEKWKEEKK